ncbi:MbtH family NRPS accessory protein [Amycolatopsis sp. EV170708-02-1]
MFEDDGDRLYDVARNNKEQYSLWPADRKRWYDPVPEKR